MNNSIQKEKGLNKIALIVILFCSLFTSSIKIHAQDSDLIKPKRLYLKDTTYSKETEGIFKRLLQAIKFRENRNIKEQERVYQFIDELIENRDLNIDSNIKEINRVLDSLNKADGIIKKIDTIEQKISNNQKNIDSLRVKVIDSFRVAFETALDSVVKKSMKSYLTKQHQKDSTYQEKLEELRSINYTCKCLENKSDSLIQPCLKPKTKIIGWHKFSEKDEYKNYNYNYLSAINLYGYELGPDGKAMNPNNLRTLNNSQGVVSLANKYGTDIYLTIFNNSAKEVSQFLTKNNNAQNILINELNSLASAEIINGVNIYFNDILKKDSHNFVYFIQKLSDKLEEYCPQLVINITIPAIYDNNSLENVSFYNFHELNKVVDNYIVLTDKMTSLNNNWAQPASPLYSDDKSGFGTIESTINFYANGKIPLSKLIMTVSYQGLAWPVLDFVGNSKGEVDPYRKNPHDLIKYKDILKDYVNNRNRKSELSMTQKFDSVQVSAYLNIIDSINYFEPQKTQLWYENKTSLEIKYKWLLDKELAGLSIRELGYDDGHSDLWDALGASLIEIDSTNKSTKKLKQCLFKLISNKDLLDTKVFVKNKYSIQSVNEDSFWYKYQEYDYSRDDDDSWYHKYLKKSFLYSEYRWAEEPLTEYVTKFGKSDLKITSNKKYLADEEACECLYERFIILSHISFLMLFICILIISSLILIKNYLDRLNKGRKWQHFILKNLIVIFKLLSVILLLWGLYINPRFNKFGAGNEGELGFVYLFLIVFFGIIVGVFGYYRYIKGDYFSKNLP